MIKISLNVQDSRTKLFKALIGAGKTAFSKALKLAKAPIERDIQDYVVQLVHNTRTIQSIRSTGINTLSAQFGFEDGNVYATDLLEALRQNIFFSTGPVQTNLKGLFASVQITIDIQGILGDMRYGSYYSDGRVGGNVDWAEWLLTRGSSKVVVGSKVVYLDPNKKSSAASRSGYALMTDGGFYSVPGAYAGIVTDNFISRAIKEHDVLMINRIMRDRIFDEF